MKSTSLSLLAFFLYFSQVFATNTIALTEVLDKNGKISNPRHLSGTLDFSGFYPVMDDCEGLMFLPAPPPAPGWNALGSGLSNGVNAIAISGSDVYIGGGFTDAGGNANADRIARWDGSAWNALGSGLNSTVLAIAISGSDVYVGGLFANAGGNANADRIARWDGSTWNALGNFGVTNSIIDVRAIAILSSDVYVGGDFANAGGNSNANYIARWDGSTWNALGSGLNTFVYAITISGSGAYVGGFFTDAGSNADADRIAYWDGSTWNALGSGLNGSVAAIAIIGSDVYVGGNFTDAGGNADADRIAYWDGSTWNALGSGLNGTVAAIAISGSDVYMGGGFTDAGGNADADRIARWDGSTWNALGSGLNSGANEITVSGSDVYVGGNFTDAGGNTNADRIARWEEAPLPVELLGFQATAFGDGSALLTWRTASETQNAHFLVQHSTDWRSFHDLAKIPGKGDSQVENHYEYLHENPSHGTNYYRLKQVDLNGSFEYSQVVSIDFGVKEEIRLFPNPFSNSLQVDINSEQDELPAQLFDVTGRQVWKGLLHSGRQEVALPGQQAGVFWLEVDFGNRKEQVRLVKTNSAP